MTDNKKTRFELNRIRLVEKRTAMPSAEITRVMIMVI